MLLSFLLLPVWTLLLATHAWNTGPGPPIALYFVGEPRTLNTTLCSLTNNVLRPLRNEGWDITIFIYTPPCASLRQYDLLRALGKVKVVQKVVKDPEKPSRQCIADFDRHIHLVRSDYNEELLAHIRDMEGIDLLRLQYEEEKSIKFDWIIFLRPDVTYIDSIPSIRALPHTHVYVPIWHSYGGINDRFAIVPRQYTAPYFHLYTALCVRNQSAMLPEYIINPERCYRWYLQSQGVPLNVVREFFFVRTRDFHTRLGHFAERDMPVLGPERCMVAFKYRCCRLVPRSGALVQQRSNCTKLMLSAVHFCKRYARSAVREAAAGEVYATDLLVSNSTSARMAFMPHPNKEK